MTPLPHELVSDSTLPLKDRKYDEINKRLRLLDGVHFFEVSAVRDVAHDLANDLISRGTAVGRLAFLPAPRSMIDFSSLTPNTSRVAMLLEEDGVGSALVTMVFKDRATGSIEANPRPILRLRLSGTDEPGVFYIRSDEWDLNAAGTAPSHAAALAYAFLALINTPRIIGRHQHMPHAGLQRKIAAAHRIPGKYPLQAWHELTLKVTPPMIDADGPRESHLTGAKARHFVRQHLRVVGGVLVRIGGKPVVLGGKDVQVVAHWRGDPALGIKRTRYRLAS